MLFMVIERFEGNDPLRVYKRVRDEGRTLPDGLTYIDSLPVVPSKDTREVVAPFIIDG